MRSAVTLTLDSSAAFDLLVADTPQRNWLRQFVAGHDFVAPTLFRFELTNLIRRAFAQKQLSDTDANATLRAALSMPLTEYSFEFALPRAWALRGSFTFTDASYIAVAEATGTALVTLDRRIARGPTVQCDIVLPPRTG